MNCYDDCLSYISKKPVKTTQKPFANFNTSFFEFHVEYFANIFFLHRITFIVINCMIFLPWMVSFAGTDTY